MPTKKQRLENLLKELNSVAGTEGSAIVSRDGLLIASEVSSDIDTETFAAMSATMTGAAETAVFELKRGAVESVIVESKGGKIISVGTGPKAILVSIIGPKAVFGLQLVEMKKIAKKIAAEIE